MKAEVTAALSKDEARSLTDEVKADAAALWAKLLRLYEGGAHTVLGYSSWGAYYEAEFGQSGKRGEQLLRAARVVKALEDTSVSPPASEAVARELAPTLKDRGAGAVRETWSQAVERNGDQPTAAQVREVVGERQEVPRPLRLTPTQRLVQRAEEIIAEFDYRDEIGRLLAPIRRAAAARYFELGCSREQVAEYLSVRPEELPEDAVPTQEALL